VNGRPCRPESYSQPPERRWDTFELRCFFILVVGWTQRIYSVNWIDYERFRFIKDEQQFSVRQTFSRKEIQELRDKVELKSSVRVKCIPKKCSHSSQGFLLPFRELLTIPSHAHRTITSACGSWDPHRLRYIFTSESITKREMRKNAGTANSDSRHAERCKVTE
jgi:hypothetical protein